MEFKKGLLKKKENLVNRFWIAVAVLLIVNLTISDSVNADGALKGFQIVKGKHPKRRLGHPTAIEHSWVVPFKNQNYTFSISIDTQLYNKARNKERLRRGDFKYFPSMVEEGTEALQDLNREFKRVTSTWNKESQVNFVLAFVHSITYIKDERTGFDEYYKSAIETLGDEEGDCEDSSILFASILSGLGFELALIVFPGSRFVQGHVGVGVKGNFQGDYCRDGNNEYYYCETTSPGWKLGVFPPGYEYRRREIMPIHPNPNPPKPVIPQVKRPKPTPPKRLAPQQTLEKGIKLYEQARFNEAIKSLRSVLNRDGINFEQQALAHLYWGCSELGRTNRENRDYRNYVLKAKKQFEEAFRHDPDRILPPRIGEDHPVFGPLFEEVRKESIGKLTVTASPPQTGIWIYGNGIKRKKLGVGTVSVRLFKGSYTVVGIYEGVSQKENVKIEPNRHEPLELKIAYKQRIVKHKPPPTVSAGEKIPLIFDVISSEKPKQVNIVGKQRFIGKVPDDFAVRSFDRQTDEVKWIYKVNLPAQNSVGKFEYKIKVEYENFPPIASPELEGAYHRIDIVDEAAPIIRLITPENGAIFNVNQRITISAEVTDNTSVKEVLVHFSPTNKLPLYKTEIYSDIYTGSFRGEKAGVIRYYLTAIDEGGKQDESEVRHVEIVEPLEPVILEPRNGATFNVNQTITIKAEITNTSVELVRLFYGFSESSRVEPTYYDDKFLTGTSSGIYIGYIFESEPGYIWYYVTATNEGGKLGKPEKRWLKIVGPREPRDLPPPPPKPGLARHQGIWASVSTDDPTTFDLDSDKMFRLAYLREGKAHSTLGAQLDFSYPDRTDVSTMFQFGPALGKSKFALTLLGGIAEYEDSPRSTHTTPILGAGVKFYPWDNIAIDATTSIKDRSNHDTTVLYHYEIGARVYITRELNLRVGYGKLYLGDEDVTTMQIGLGYTF